MLAVQCIELQRKVIHDCCKAHKNDPGLEKVVQSMQLIALLNRAYKSDLPCRTRQKLL